MIRNPVVAGQFYPSEPKILIHYLENYIKKMPKKSALGAIVPHAGYVYSGGVAGVVYGCLQLPDTFIVLGPNHSGMGKPFAVMDRGIWKTPLGEVIMGNALAKAIQKFGKPTLIIASSDMTHYEPHETAKAKDNMAIEQILALDAAGLYETVHSKNITMCGIIPATVMLIATKSLGAKKAELVSYATSGDISGDYSQVVGYAGIIIK